MAHQHIKGYFVPSRLQLRTEKYKLDTTNYNSNGFTVTDSNTTADKFTQPHQQYIYKLTS